MKKLLLLRHAKSSWDEVGLEDHERPLSRRGRRACERIGAWLAERPAPELVACSSARRTRETAGRVLAHLAVPPPLRIEPVLYLASEEEMLACVRALPEHCGHAMLVGHNPGTWDLALRLAGRGDASLLERVAAKFPTGAVAVLDLPVGSWRDTAMERGALVDFITPRTLEDRSATRMR